MKRFKISRKELIFDLKRVASILNKKTVTTEDYREHGRYAIKTVKKYLGSGSWEKSLKQAGLKAERSGKGHIISKNEIIVELKRVSKLLGKKCFTVEEYNAYGKISSSVIRDKFKSWNRALKKAGLCIVKEQSISDKKLLMNIKEVAKKLGKNTLIMEEYQDHGKFDAHTMIKRFGSWSKTLLNAGLFPKVSNEDNFLDVCKSHEAIKAIVEAFNGDEADIVNVLSIISCGKWSKRKMTKWLVKPKLRKWMGEFRKPSLQPRAILEASFTLLPYDKNNVIRKLLLDRLINWADAERGANPTKARKAKVIKLLEGYVTELLAQAA